MYEMPNQFEYDGMILPGNAITVDKIKQVGNIKIKPSDVLIPSYPRSGNTWMIESTYLIMTEGDIASAKTIPLNERAVYLEHKHFQGDQSKEKEFTDDNLANADKLKKQRILKTHLHFRHMENQIINQNAKTIVVVRNPYDMLVSFFHFYQSNNLLGNFDREWNDFFEMFKNGGLIYGDWLDHVSGYWKRRDDVKNMLFVKYEDAKSDLLNTLKQMGSFLGKDLSDDTYIKIAEHVSFDTMKSNDMVNFTRYGVFKKELPAIRKGEVGGWVSYFTDEQMKFVEDHYISKAKAMGLEFRLN